MEKLIKSAQRRVFSGLEVFLGRESLHFRVDSWELHNARPRASRSIGLSFGPLAILIGHRLDPSILRQHWRNFPFSLSPTAFLPRPKFTWNLIETRFRDIWWIFRDFPKSEILEIKQYENYVIKSNFLFNFMSSEDRFALVLKILWERKYC